MQDIHHETIYRTEEMHWWYRVRRVMTHDLIWHYFPNRTDLKILDVGCGTGGLLKELTTYGEISGIDVSDKALAYAGTRSSANLSIGGATAIPFPENTFDLVLTLDVIEHVEDDLKALSEVKRVLKPGGISFVFVPAFMFLWGINDIRSQHYRRYTRKELVQKLKVEGFTVSRASYFNTFLFVPIALLRIVARILKIKIESDVELGNPFVDAIFYRTFLLESRLLRFVNFPFGVSVMAISRKESQ